MRSAPQCWKVLCKVQPEHPDTSLNQGISKGAILLRLVVQTRDLHVLSHKFAMLVATTKTPPHQTATNATILEQVQRQFFQAWQMVQDAHLDAVSDGDPATMRMIAHAFSPRTQAAFAQFDRMATDLCSQFRRGHVPQDRSVETLVQLISGDLYGAIDAVLAVILRLADESAQQAQQLALTDALTGLPNRSAYHDLIQRNDTKVGAGGHVAVMHIDLDNFKQINDTFGHATGDLALCHAAAALRAHAQPDDFVARVGGDEFVFICFAGTSDPGLAHMAEQMLQSIQTPFTHLGKECHVKASIGIASGDGTAGLSLDRYMNNADLALYQAKNAGRSRFQFFTPHLRSQYEEIEELKSQMREGLKSGQFEPYFQPQVEGRTGKVVGFESLARWHHPTRGLLMPGDYFGAAVEGGFLDQLDRVLMEQTFAALRLWLDKGYRVRQVSINLTATRLQEIDLVDTLTQAAGRADIDPHLLGVEILESVMIDTHSDQIIQNIQNLSDAGFKVELDDFGTGHASISNLKNFKVDRIKIDRSFVKDVHLHSELSKITAAMIGLAHSLRVDALAEGVETPEERLVLNALGCDHIQGYGVARPMRGGDVPRWMQTTNQTRTLPPRRNTVKGATPHMKAS